MRQPQHAFLLLVALTLSGAACGFGTPSRTKTVTTDAVSGVRKEIARILVDEKQPARELNDSELGDCIDQLLQLNKDTNSNSLFDPVKVAGTWRVVHAPHLYFLSKFALAQFGSIEYYLTADCKMAASVRYKTAVGDWEGWLSTAGTYTVDDNAENDIVRIVWDQCWWNTNLGDSADRPTPPHQGDYATLIQELGMVGFIEPLSFFPVTYVDEGLASFSFFGLKITAAKVPDPSPSIYVERP